MNREINQVYVPTERESRTATIQINSNDIFNKGLADVIKLFQLVLEKHPDARLVDSGDYYGGMIPEIEYTRMETDLEMSGRHGVECSNFKHQQLIAKKKLARDEQKLATLDAELGKQVI